MGETRIYNLFILRGNDLRENENRLEESKGFYYYRRKKIIIIIEINIIIIIEERSWECRRQCQTHLIGII